MELAALIVAIISAIAACAAVFVTWRLGKRTGSTQDAVAQLQAKQLEVSDRANAIQNELLRVQHGSVEDEIRSAIATARARTEDIGLMHADLLTKTQNLTTEEALRKELLNKAISSALEGTLNAYELACSRYLDNKLDRERFKKTFHTEIRQLVEDDNHKSFFDPLTTRYRALLKVYAEWNNLE